MILHLETSKKPLLLASSEIVDRPPPSMKLPKSVRFLRSSFPAFQNDMACWISESSLFFEFWRCARSRSREAKKKNKTKGSFALGFRSVDLISLDNP